MTKIHEKRVIRSSFPKDIKGVCEWYKDDIPEQVTVLTDGLYKGMDAPITAFCNKSKVQMKTTMRRLTKGVCCNVCRVDKLRILRKAIESHPDYETKGRQYTVDHRLVKQEKSKRLTFRIIHDICGTPFTATYEEALEYQAKKSCPSCEKIENNENHLKKVLDLKLDL